MSETFPVHYQYPFTLCTQCGGSCYGKHCLAPGCEYIERSAFNRFERPPVPTEASLSCRRHDKTCKTVGNLTYNYGEFVTPVYLPLSNQCLTKTPGDQFQVSPVGYKRL